MNSFEIRQKFLDFFAQKGHTIVPSSSLIPAEDPTLLFTNAGMNQFKDLFLGLEQRSYKRATTCQKCVRAGGKHNDLEQVGFTQRHLTFFEMLGNFSFGDYFKDDAIPFAWEFLTKHMGLPADKLHVTIYKTDDEAYKIWHEKVGVPADHITRLGEKDNFWQMGDTGPCGPCTEIYIDRGLAFGCKQATCAPGCDCDRFMEIWNNVFMQYNRQPDGSLVPLTQTGVDTGMGLERLCSVIEGVPTVFDTDIFKTIITKIETLTQRSYAQSPEQIKAAFRVIADHVRSCSLLIADGCSPSNDGRGYVLRKIIRRAALFAQKLSADQHLFAKLATEFINYMSPVYPELTVNKQLIISILENETERFTCNLMQGQSIFEKYKDEAKATHTSLLSGEQIFKLYDTYGFPPELTLVLAREHNLELDLAGFEREMKKQQEQSGKKQSVASCGLAIPADISTTFIGYQTLENTTTIQYIHINHNDNTMWIVPQECPFYVECGGQSSDSGWVTIHGHSHAVLDIQKQGCGTNPAIALKIALTPAHTDIRVGNTIHCVVDAYTRECSVKNHTATHLLQAALIQILGPQVKQAGSQVTPQGIRFDFTHHQALTPEQLQQVEALVNQKIQENIPTTIFTATLEEAKQAGALAFFGEKYNPEQVRVVHIPGFSIELCGGTHAWATGIIGCFKITSETALATGTRRITAITGPQALATYQETFTTVKKLSEQFKVKPEQVTGAVEKLNQTYQATLTEVKALKKQLMQAQCEQHAQKITMIGNVPFLYLAVTNMENEDMRMLCQEIEKRKPGFYVLVNTNDQTTQSFIFYVSKNIQSSVNAKDLFALVKEQIPALRGGGSPAMVQGSGEIPTHFQDIVINKLKAS
ncbi:MAG: Alanine-tRNA ligase [candidate division TM6 bacterium GW2011_GWF2_38_10]|nr:MAG: Alanine-tRNA ligase [candidate division TM6 bacterium GW2011_GWF2_38_10]